MKAFTFGWGQVYDSPAITLSPHATETQAGSNRASEQVQGGLHCKEHNNDEVEDVPLLSAEEIVWCVLCTVSHQ